MSKPPEKRELPSTTIDDRPATGRRVQELAAASTIEGGPVPTPEPAHDAFAGTLDASDERAPPGRDSIEDVRRALGGAGDTVPASQSGPITPTPAGGRRGLAELPVVDARHYSIKGEVARGGLGRIVRARDRRLDRIVAIKEALRTDGAAMARFIREALVTARLQHPSIVPIYEAGTWDDGAPFYAMKLVTGRSLAKIIAEAHSLEERLPLIPNIIAVADAIAYAHSEKIIHRDLKPDNVLIGSFGETVVIDWGLAKDLTQPDEVEFAEDTGVPSTYDVVAHGLTVAGAVMGTPEYMPPEQARGGDVDERADVYAIGAILYHALTGVAPYEGTSSKDVLVRVLAGAPKPIQELQPTASPDLVAIARKAMARDPRERYATAQGLADDLRRFQTGQLVSSRTYRRSELLARWVRRHRTVFAIAGASLVALVGTGVVAVKRVVHARNVAEQERATAQAARAVSDRRSNELTLLQARTALDRDPTAALAWLKTYPDGAEDWTSARNIAVDAEERLPARHVFKAGTATWTLAFSRDGKRLATTRLDPEITLRDVATGARLGTLHAGQHPMDVAFAPDGSLVAADWNGAVYVATPGSTTLAPRYRHQGVVYTLDVSEDGALIATGGEDHAIHVARLHEGEARVFAGHTGAVQRVAFSRDGRTLASASSDGTARIWDVASGTSRVLRGHTGSLRSIALSPDGKSCATVGDDRTVRLWDLASGTGRVLATEETPSDVVHFSPDGRTLAWAGASDVRVWRVGDAAPRSLRGHTRQVLDLAFSGDGATLVSGAGDASVRVWDVAHGDAQTLVGAPGLVRTVRFAPDSSLIAAASDDGSVHVWPTPPRTSRTLTGRAAVFHVEFSPDGRWIASDTADHLVRVWDPSSGEVEQLAGHEDIVYGLAFAPDGRTLASTSFDGTARLWDLAARRARVLAGHHGSAWSPAFSPDGKLLATGDKGGGVRLWDVATGTPRLLAGHGDEVKAVAFAPDGRTLASGSRDRSVRVWDVATGVGRVLGTHDAGVYNVFYSRDGKRLVSASLDKTVRVWNPVDGSFRSFALGAPANTAALSPDGAHLAISDSQEIQLVDLDRGATSRLVGHDDLVLALRFSPDGRWLGSAGKDGTVRLWDAATGAMQVVHRAPGAARALAFSPDGKRVASSGEESVWVGAIDPRAALLPRPSEVRAYIDHLSTAIVNAAHDVRTP